MKTCIYGVGGFAREVYCSLVDSLGRDAGAVFMADPGRYPGPTLLGAQVIHREDFAPALYEVVVAVGDPAQRMAMVKSLPPETMFGSVVHHSAVVSRWVTLGPGCIITAGCVLTCDIKIGAHAQLNLHTTIGHDCVIGDYFTTAPGANVSGSCHIGDGVYVGTGAGIRQGVRIASGAVVGMGAMVVKDIESAGVYVGIPAKHTSAR